MAAQSGCSNGGDDSHCGSTMAAQSGCSNGGASATPAPPYELRFRAAPRETAMFDLRAPALVPGGRAPISAIVRSPERLALMSAGARARGGVCSGAAPPLVGAGAARPRALGDMMGGAESAAFQMDEERPGVSNAGGGLREAEVPLVPPYRGRVGRR